MARGPGIHTECCWPVPSSPRAVSSGPECLQTNPLGLNQGPFQGPGTWGCGRWAGAQGFTAMVGRGRLLEPERWGGGEPSGAEAVGKTSGGDSAGSPPRTGLRVPPHPREPPLACPLTAGRP